MNKLFNYFFVIIINYILITLVVFTFSYVSLINNKTYDLFWVKYIQKKLYFNGLRKLWNADKNCSRFDQELLYAPLEGQCEFSNPEFKTKLNFDDNRRLNMINDQIYEDEKIIAVLGDSYAMGWGVNDDETFSYKLQKLINKKVINLGVASYGTIREIKRLKLNKFYDQVDTVIIQYHLNDIYENKTLDIKKTYLISDYDKYFSLNNDKLNLTYFLLKHIKKSFRLLFSHLNDIIFKTKEKHNLSEHFDNLEKIIINNFPDQKKKIIVFLVKEPHQELIYNKKRIFSNFEFFLIDANKEHFFIIDDHLNFKGHEFVAKKIFEQIK